MSAVNSYTPPFTCSCCVMRGQKTLCTLCVYTVCVSCSRCLRCCNCPMRQARACGGDDPALDVLLGPTVPTLPRRTLEA